MVFAIQLCLIEVHFSPRSSGHRFATSSTSNKDSQLPFILKQTTRPNGKTTQWRYTVEPLSTSNRTTGQDSYQWPSSPTRMLRMRAPAIRPLGQTVATTFRYHTKKKLTPASSQSQQTNY